jgi:polar amino acid transport system permease protein
MSTSAPTSASPAPGRRLRRALAAALALVVGGLAVFFFWRAVQDSEWAEPVVDYIIFDGLPGTLRVSAAAVVGSALIGVTFGTLLTIKFLPLQSLIRLYIEVFRGLPILVTVFIVYFGLPSVSPGLEFGALTATSIALILWGSAQVAEATRGAVQSIPHEQHEAAAALGFGWVGRHGYVILPQALRRLLPPFVSLLVNIIQNSTLAQVIGGLEMLEAAERQNERITAIPPIGLGEIKAFQIFGFVMVLFFLISFPLTRLAARLEKRLV